jgi:hypothetical protein
VRCFVVMSGKLSGGTMATGILMDSLGEEVAAQRADPFLVGGRPIGRAAAAAPRARERDLEAAEFDETIRAWVGPFMMATINTRVVRCGAAPAPCLAGPCAPLRSHAEFFVWLSAFCVCFLCMRWYLCARRRS